MLPLTSLKGNSKGPQSSPKSLWKPLFRFSNISLGLIVLCLIYLYKGIDRFIRLHPAKPKIHFTRPVVIDMFEPEVPIVNRIDPETIVYSVLIPVITPPGASSADLKKVGRCLESVKVQRGRVPHADFVLKSEIIVVYDESSGIQSLIDECQTYSPTSSDEKALGYDCTANTHLIRFIKNPVKGDLSRYMNYGIQYAKGMWILPLDIEDLIHPFFLAEISLEFDRKSKDLSPMRPGLYNVIMPSVMDFNKKALSWQPTSNTSTLFNENPFHGSGLFLRSTWESGVQYGEWMTGGWQNWDFWIKLENQIKITALIVEKPLLKFNVSHHSGGFCQENRDTCMALLHVKNPCVFERERVIKSFNILREYKDRKQYPDVRNVINREIENIPAFKPLLAGMQTAGSLRKELFSTFYARSCTNGKSPVCDSTVSRMLQLSDIQSKSDTMSMFHIIVTTMPEDGEVWRQIFAHVVVSVLDLHPQATVIIHTDFDLAHVVGETMIQYYGDRLMSLPMQCLSSLADDNGMTTVATYMRQFARGRPYYHDQKSDYARLLILYVFGGVHLDTDMLLRQQVDDLHNAAALETSGVVNGGFLTFDRFHPVMKHCLEQIHVVHDPFNRGSIGPDLITKASKIYSYEIYDNGNLKFNVLPKHTFYSSNVEELAFPHVTQPVYNKRGLNGELGYHLQGRVFRSGATPPMSSYSVLGHAFRDSCNPDIMSCVELDRMG